MNTRVRALLFTAAAAGILLTAAACGDDADSNSSAQQTDIDTINATIQDNEVLFAIKAVGDLPLHDMDESINAGTIEDSYLGVARDAVRYMAITDWPTSLEEDAQAVEDAAIALVTALDEGDNEAAKQPATDLHELWHDFEGAAWSEIGGDLPPEAGIDGAHEPGGGTPTDETPTEGATEEAH